MKKNYTKSSKFKLKLWGVTDGKVGMDNQCLGLAEALGVDIEMMPIQRLTFPWNKITPFCRPPAKIGCYMDTVMSDAPIFNPSRWPDIIFTCGRQSIYPSLAIKAFNDGNSFLMKLQSPQIKPKHFDLVIVPKHDALRGDNVKTLFGAPHRVTKKRILEEAKNFQHELKNMPKFNISVMLGGPNDVFGFTKNDVAHLADSLKSVVNKYKAGLLITCSRRTPKYTIDILKKSLEHVPYRLWEGEGNNPYFGYLGLGDAIIVTGDSVSMISEATIAEKPVYIFELQGGSHKFNRFYDAVVGQGSARIFMGDIDQWETEAFNETLRGAHLIQEEMITFFDRTHQYEQRDFVRKLKVE